LKESNYGGGEKRRRKPYLKSRRRALRKKGKASVGEGELDTVKEKGAGLAKTPPSVVKPSGEEEGGTALKKNRVGVTGTVRIQ